MPPQASQSSGAAQSVGSHQGHRLSTQAHSHPGPSLAVGMFPVRGGKLVDGLASVGGGVMNDRGVSVFTVLLLQITAVGARLKGRGRRFAKRHSFLLHVYVFVWPSRIRRCFPEMFCSSGRRVREKPLNAPGSLATCPACVIGCAQDHVISTEINAKSRTQSVQLSPTALYVD